MENQYEANGQNWPLSYSYAALSKSTNERMCCSPGSQGSVDSSSSTITNSAIMVNGVNIHDEEINCVDSLNC